MRTKTLAIGAYHTVVVMGFTYVLWDLSMNHGNNMLQVIIYISERIL